MKCKRHRGEQGVGVCPSCLRERLFALIDAQNEPPIVHHYRDPDLRSPPILFPRSASPFASRRSHSSTPRRHRFFSTPQAVHATAAAGDGGGGSRGSVRFSLLSYLFSNAISEEKEPDPKDSRSSSWLSALLGRRRRIKKSRMFSAEMECPGRGRAPCQAMDRGMSPVIDRGMSPAIDESDCGSESGYSTASSGAWQMPTSSYIRRAATAHHHHGSSRMSGFAPYLSPLVRPNPGFRRGQTPEVGFSGDLQAAMKSNHHNNFRASSSGAALAPNRSRKLADFGRFR